jgi:hypothetical protein
MGISTRFDSLVEKKIREAMDEGKFDNISGLGKPMDLGKDPYMPEDLRLAYKVLKNAGCVPRELEANVEIRSLEQMLDKTDDLSCKLKAAKKLRLLKQKLHQSKNYTKIFDIPDNYEELIVEKIEKKTVPQKS